MIKNLQISFENNCRLDKKLVNEIVKNLKTKLNFEIESMDINFVSKNSIWEVNEKFLKHNYPTDIITFNYSGKNDSLDGEIFICPEVAVENAVTYKCSVDNEILRLIVHGFLHLLGYDDINEEDRKEMKTIEDSTVLNFEKYLENKSFGYDSKTC